MNLNFDIENVEATEFGVGRQIGSDRSFVVVPVVRAVQETLQDIVTATCQKMERNPEPPLTFDPAEKYASEEYLTLPIDNDLALPLRTLHQTSNLPITNDALTWITKSFCYFARFWDNQSRQLTTIRRAAQFKGALNKQNRILSLGTDALRIMEDPIFQLNADFDVVVDSELVHIIHPTSFKLLGQIEEAIAEAVPRNVEAISRAASYVDWSNIEEYAVGHSRAASLLASIRTQGYAANLDEAALVALCVGTGVDLDTFGEQIAVPEEQILPFLEVIDRRRYEIGLVPRTPEQYRASSRTRLGGRGT